jgi:hypothetical protein
MQDLSLQVRSIHDIAVDDAEFSDAGCSQVIGSGTAESASAQHQHIRVEQFKLAFLADFRNRQVSTVSCALFVVQRLGDMDRISGLFPGAKATGDGFDIIVAELFERFRSQCRTRATGTIQDDFFVFVGDEVFDLQVEKAARDEGRPFDVPIAPFIALTNIDHLDVIGLPAL